jgi:fido (protein-threonine AMPylation protein)
LQDLREKLEIIMLVFSNPTNYSSISKNVKNGTIFKIYEGIYTNDQTKIDTLVDEKLGDILQHLQVSATYAYKSAYNNSGDVVMVAAKDRTLQIGNKLIKIYKANEIEINNSIDRIKIKDGIYKSGPYRRILENLSSRAVDSKKIDNNLAIDDIHSVVYRNNADQSKIETFISNLEHIAKELNMAKELEKAKQYINDFSKSFLSTYGVDYDYRRIEMFDKLFDEIVNNNEIFEFDNLDRKYTDYNSFRHIAFFESYFSNYIEGTKFEPEEAKEYIFTNKPYERHKDGHDLKSLYDIAMSHQYNVAWPTSEDEFVIFLKHMHKSLMNHRPEVKPGEFKTLNNRAGNTSFVDKTKVIQMIKHVFKQSQQIENIHAQAIYLSLALSEIHPFEDGNGRICRLIMNARLSSCGFDRIILPTVFRNDYMPALKAFSNPDDTNASPILGFFANLIQANHEINFTQSIDEIITMLDEKQAFYDEPGVLWIWEKGVSQ